MTFTLLDGRPGVLNFDDRKCRGRNELGISRNFCPLAESQNQGFKRFMVSDHHDGFPVFRYFGQQFHDRPGVGIVDFFFPLDVSHINTDFTANPFRGLACPLCR